MPQCDQMKTDRPSEQQFIDGLIERIHGSYADGNAINHSDGNNLPRESEILAILHDLLELVFPGFQERASYSASNIKYTVGEIVSRCYSELKDIVFRSIRYNCKVFSKEECSRGCSSLAEESARYVLSAIPGIRDTMKLDITAAFEGDPAAKTHAEIVLSYPGVKAIAIQRIAHCLYERDVPLIPRMMCEYAHRITGIDIHPGAKLGKSVFIDHGTGVVIGETAVIGSNVKIYQGVTIGALSFPKDASGNIIKGRKRHPTIEDDVTIYAGATILGAITVGKSTVVGGNAWITEDVEPYSKITISPPRLTITKKTSRSAAVPAALPAASGAPEEWKTLPETVRNRMRSAAKAVFSCSLALGKEESALLVFDSTTLSVAHAFRLAAAELGLKLDERLIGITAGDGADPDAGTVSLMHTHQAVIAPAFHSLTHCPAMTSARRKTGVRAVTLPGITNTLFADSMPGSPGLMRKDGEAWLSVLRGKHKFRLLSAAGSELEFEAGDIPFESDDGICVRAGDCGNIPAGEVFAVPSKMNGKLVIDGSISGLGWKESDPPCVVEILENAASSFEGERALALEKILLAAGPEALRAAEFGIGMNRSLSLTGNLLGDEKVMGTVHIAFGNSAGMGGDNDVPVHIDCLVREPTLLVDGKTVMEKGVWRL